MSLNRGVLAALGAAALFGLSTPLAKALLKGLPPTLLAGLLYLGSGLGLALLLALRALRTRAHRPPATVQPSARADWRWLLVAAAFGGLLGPTLLLYGLSRASAADASLTLNLEGVFTALLAWFVFRENFDRRILLGMISILAGAAVLSSSAVNTRGGGSTIVGLALIAGACLAWAVDNNLTRKVASHDAMTVACIKGLVASPVNLVIAWQLGARMPSAAQAFAAGVLGFIGYGLSLTLFIVALRHLGTARTGAYFSTAPFLGAVLAVLLGAPLTGALVLSAALMAFGVWLHLTEHHAHRHRHESLHHEHPHHHDDHHRHAHTPDWDGREPHSHPHTHEPMEHSHAHYPDLHHRHEH